MTEEKLQSKRNNVTYKKQLNQAESKKIIIKKSKRNYVEIDRFYRNFSSCQLKYKSHQHHQKIQQ